MRYLFLVYIAVMAVFSLATVATDWSQRLEFDSRARAAAEEKARQAAQAEAERQRQLRAQQAAEQRRLQEELDRQKREQAQLRLKEIEDRCDQLAGNTFDPFRNRAFPGVPYDILRINATAAIARCREAIAESPDNPRLRYQLARALQSQKNPEAKKLLTALTQENYLVAYDNLGWWYQNEGDYRMAASYFRAGAQLNDPESMVSYAGYLLEGRFVPKDEHEAIRILAEAEKVGHPAAGRAMNRYREQQRMNTIGLSLFAVVLGEILKRGQ